MCMCLMYVGVGSVWVCELVHVCVLSACTDAFILLYLQIIRFSLIFCLCMCSVSVTHQHHTYKHTDTSAVRFRICICVTR